MIRKRQSKVGAFWLHAKIVPSRAILIMLFGATATTLAMVESASVSRYRFAKVRTSVLALLVITPILLATTMNTLGMKSVSADASHQAVIGMPFTGKWAWNAKVMQPFPPYVDKCPNGEWNCPGLSSHPSVHHTPNGGNWATDIYASEGTPVKLEVGYTTGSLDFKWGWSSTSCGQSTLVNVYVSGVNVGWIYFAHLNHAVKSGPITNGMILGTVHDWGGCNPGVHVHIEFKNTTNYSCFVDHGNPGITLNQGDNLGVLGSMNTGPRQACTRVPSGGGPGSKPGDCNGDGRVDAVDLSILLSHINQAYAPCDFNHDGIVNIFDLSILLGHYGT